MSYGSTVHTVDFTNGMHLIFGKNGTGKTTQFIALYYALFGKPYKKNKVASLINETIKKELLVTLTFIVDNDNYKIVRGQKPSIFEIYCNDILLNQNSTNSEYQTILEESILKFNETIFKQLIFLGANVNTTKSFVDLTKAEKEELFSIITDTAIFSELKEAIKLKSKQLTANKTELDYKSKVLKELIIAEEANIKKLIAHNASVAEQNEEVITLLQDKIKNIEESITKYDEALIKLKEKKSIYDSEKYILEVMNGNANGVKKDLDNLKLQLRRIEDVEKTFSHCIGCATLNKISDVDISVKPKVLLDIESLTETYDKLLVAINQKAEEVNALLELLQKGKQVKISKEAKEQELNSTLAEIQRIQNTVVYEIDNALLETKTIELTECNIHLETVGGELINYDKLNKLFDNNNIKGLIIKQSLPLLNKFINEYLDCFTEFPFKFNVDETFSTSLKRTNGLDNYEYDFQSLSNGQAMRITFSIILAFLRLVEYKNGVSTNLLILDEILDSSLDTDGRLELLELLKNNFTEKSIYIISHNDEIKNTELFDIQYHVSTVDNFSNIEQQ
jgi:DNA repair exonuclease SbcCD ATPase subunit